MRWGGSDLGLKVCVATIYTEPCLGTSELYKLLSCFGRLVESNNFFPQYGTVGKLCCLKLGFLRVCQQLRFKFRGQIKGKVLCQN